MIGLNKEKLKARGFTQDQIVEIFQGIEDNVNIGFYLELHYSGLQMHEIRLGLLDGLDVAVYSKPEYDWFQMEELRKGLRDKVDTSLYADPSIPYRKMREMRRGLIVGHDLTAFLKYDAGTIREYRKALEESINIAQFLEQGYKAEQLEQIRLALEDGVDISPYLDLSYTGAALQEIRRGLLDQVEVERYARKFSDWRKMRELRLGLKNQVDISLYDNPFYSWQQMHEIRLGLMQGLDIKRYNSFMFPAAEMRRKRLAMIQELKDALAEKRAREMIKEDDYSIVFSDNNMSAMITFFGDRTHLTEKSIRNMLEENKITYGILDSAIEQLLDLSADPIDLIVAEGTPVVNGKNGYYDFFFRTNVSRVPKILEDGSADYLNLEWFESVKAGQKLAEYHEATKGVDGISVFGEVIRAKNGIESKTLIGNGFEMSEDRKTYYSLVNGIITLHENRMNINNLLRVDEVSLATGNLTFDGSVHVRGDVENGMTIDVTEDLIIDGNVGAAKITCGGNVILKKGMNSGGNGVIKAKGYVESRYFESSTIEADGDIRFNTSLNCTLYAKGTIVSHQTLAGGRASSESGFRLKDVGNKAWIKTRLDIVQDKELKAYYDKTMEKISGYEEELETLRYHRQELLRKYDVEVVSGMEVFTKLEDAIYTKQLHLAEGRKNLAKCMSLIQRAQTSKVVISGQAFLGVIVSAGDFHWSADNNTSVTISAWDKKVTY